MPNKGQARNDAMNKILNDTLNPFLPKDLIIIIAAYTQPSSYVLLSLYGNVNVNDRANIVQDISQKINNDLINNRFHYISNRGFFDSLDNALCDRVMVSVRENLYTIAAEAELHDDKVLTIFKYKPNDEITHTFNTPFIVNHPDKIIPKGLTVIVESTPLVKMKNSTTTASTEKTVAPINRYHLLSQKSVAPKPTVAMSCQRAFSSHPGPR